MNLSVSSGGERSLKFFSDRSRPCADQVICPLHREGKLPRRTGDILYASRYRWPVLCLELCQERFGLLEVGRVKALGEPVVDFCQQLSGRCGLPLPLPEPREAQCSAQLQCLGLLATGYVQCLLETGFRLAHIGK